jgi:hypothetical protein
MMDHELSAQLTEAIAVAATHEVVAERAEHLEFKPNLAMLTGGALLQWVEMTTQERVEKLRQADTSRKRKARAAQQRSTERERKQVTKPKDPTRLRACLGIVGTLFPLVSKVVTAKYNKMRRVLGDTEREDIAANVVMRLSNALGNSKFELIDLAEGALWLAEQPGIPNLPKRRSDDIPFACKAIMGLIGTIARTAIVDAYRAHPNWVSLEMLATMGEQIRSVDDVVTERMVAKSPGHFESKPPGRPDARVFASHVIDVAIEARGLTWLADLIEANTRTDGLMTWTANADAIWEGFELPPMQVESPELRAQCAKDAARQAFEYLPDVVRRAHEIVADPLAMYDIVHLPKSVWQPRVARTVDDELPETDYASITLIPKLDGELRDLYNGRRFFLEGMNEGDAPVKLFDGPGPDEWKKIRKVQASFMACEHGPRKQIFGTTKKAGAWPRPWTGHFCSLQGGDACTPVFGPQVPMTATERAAQAILASQ